MFCSRCGARLNDGAMFCTQCGKKVASEDTALNFTDTSGQDISEQQIAGAVEKDGQSFADDINNINYDAGGTYSESKSEKAVNIFFEKLGDFLAKIIEWHKKFLDKNKIAAAALIIIEAALAIWLLFKTWVICLGILIVASIVLPFIMKHDFTEKDRQNSKEIIIGFIALTVFLIILFIILFNWEPVSSIWDH